MSKHLTLEDCYHQLKKSQLKARAYLPFTNKISELKSELGLLDQKILFDSEKIVLVLTEDSSAPNPIWAQDVWCDLEMILIDQPKSKIINHLKQIPNLGCYYNSSISKRANGLREQLREFKVKRLKYSPFSDFNFKFFTWTILNDQYLLISKNPLQKFPLGWNEFEEDKNFPPNRAYLKLWEIFTLSHISKPSLNESALELGASPGGWTWVLSQHFKKVYAIDRSPLASQIAQIKNISFRTGDAFKLNPSDYLDCQWLFSDLICTPEKLFETVQFWKKESSIKNFVCTIKFKGSYNPKIVDEFKSIPGSKIIHLYQNKNELTWINLEKYDNK